jgi:hypothetical protein
MYKQTPTTNNQYCETTMHARPSSDKILLIKYEKYAEVGKNSLSLLPNKHHLFRGLTINKNK